MARKMMLKNIDGFDEWLTMEYKNGKTMKELAKTCNCTPAAILGNMKRIGIESRTHGYHLIGKTMSEENKARLSKIHKGKTVSLETRKKQSETMKSLHLRSSKWKGGKRTGRTDGYIQQYIPEHKNASKDGYVMEHRLIMEKMLGRTLDNKEVVHHINGITNDNRCENLQLFSSLSEHTTYHCKQRRENKT